MAHQKVVAGPRRGKGTCVTGRAPGRTRSSWDDVCRENGQAERTRSRMPCSRAARRPRRPRRRLAIIERLPAAAGTTERPFERRSFGHSPPPPLAHPFSLFCGCNADRLPDTARKTPAGSCRCDPARASVECGTPLTPTRSTPTCDWPLPRDGHGGHPLPTPWTHYNPAVSTGLARIQILNERVHFGQACMVSSIIRRC